MKKVLTIMGCAMLMAVMAVACNNKKTAEEPVADENTVAIEEAAPAQEAVENAAMSDADHQAMLDAAAEAGRAKCNCYKTDAASVESCIKSILQQSYADYEGNEEFKAAMEAEFNACVKEKATEAVTNAAEKAVKDGANALANKLKNN